MPALTVAQLAAELSLAPRFLCAIVRNLGGEAESAQDVVPEHLVTIIRQQYAPTSPSKRAPNPPRTKSSPKSIAEIRGPIPKRKKPSPDQEPRKASREELERRAARRHERDKAQANEFRARLDPARKEAERQAREAESRPITRRPDSGPLRPLESYPADGHWWSGDGPEPDNISKRSR